LITKKKVSCQPTQNETQFANNIVKYEEAKKFADFKDD